MIVTLSQHYQQQKVSPQQLGQQIWKIIIKFEQIAKYIEQSTDETIFYEFCHTSRSQLITTFMIGIEKMKSTMNKLGDKKMNLKVLMSLVSYINKICSQGRLQISQGIKKALWILQIESKINILIGYVEIAAKMENDVVTQGFRKHPSVKRKIKFNKLSNFQKVSKQQDFMKSIMRLTISAVQSQQVIQNQYLGKLVFGMSFPRFLISKQKSQLNAVSYLRAPTLQMTQNIWNLPEKGATNHLKYAFYQSIKYNQELYIPLNTNQNISNIFQPNQNSIKVRLLHFQKINQKQGKILKNLEGNKTKKIQTIIIHFHGGGFIALSSSTMQSYTRKWANQTQIPVFSVDYRKPPQCRFPTVVEDCVSVYKFITERINQYLDINPLKVILAGDSSGGNLACSLMGLILKQKLAPVHGIFLVYPAVDLRNKFTPSFVNSFQEPVLYPTLLHLCLKEYLGQGQQINQYNPLASPLLLTENFVSGCSNNFGWPKKWPKTIIMVGKKDPLYDDCLRFMQRMVSSKIDCHCEVYQYFSHAFLSMDNIHGQVDVLINDSINFLKRLID